MKHSKSTLYRVISLLIKLSIVIAAFGFIYKQIFLEKDLSTIGLFAKEMIAEGMDYLLLISVVVLMFINWGIESAKWRFLIQKIETISFAKSLKAIFSGACVSIFTPNRIGEFGGRIFYLKHADRIQAIIITIIGSMSQLLITVVFGSIALLVFLMHYYSHEINTYWLYAIDFIVLALVFLSVSVFLNTSVITLLLSKMLGMTKPGSKENILKKWRKYIEVFAFYSSRELMALLLFSCARYLVFSLQFYILLVLFEVNAPVFEGLLMIMLTFFVLAVVPTVSLTELGVRGSVAIYFIGLLSENSLGIFAASFGLWVINIVIPALIGSLFIFDLNFFRTSVKKSY